MTKEIQLTQGKVTLVDDDVYEWASKFKWYALSHERGFYSVRSSKDLLGRGISIRLHREILNAPMGIDVDHINGDGLDNRRCNLRLATRAENLRNGRSHSDSTSGYKGVCWSKSNKKWLVRIMVNGKDVYLGHFDSPQEAAHVYDKAAIEHFKEFAHLNFPDVGYTQK